MISETKLDNSFPNNEFLIPGFTEPYRLDRDSHGGGLLLYVRNDIPSKEIPNCNLSTPSEGLFVEINLRKKKWLISCSYIPNKNLIQSHLLQISNKLDLCSLIYDNFILMGDFNTEPHDTYMEDFCLNYNLSNLIKEPTCFKNTENPSCIDLILTNSPKSFQHSMAIETGLSDFHKMTVTVMRSHYQKQKPKIICYINYKNFSNELFRKDITRKIEDEHTNNMRLDKLQQTFLDILDKHAPVKHKYLRANQASFMNKTLQHSVMKRSMLKNKFLKYRTPENWEAYKKQRNSCVYQFRKERKAFFNNLDTKTVTDNKLFWKVIKPSFSDKARVSGNITLVENNEIINNVTEICEIFNNFFGDIVANLNIPEIPCSPNCDGINDTVSMAIKKYENHPSINEIKKVRTLNQPFSFQPVIRDEIEKEITNLDTSKASHESDIPCRIIKANSDILSGFLTYHFNNNLLDKGIFPDSFKKANITPIFKKDSRTEKSNYRPVSILPNLSKIFERLMSNQLSKYFEDILSKFQCGFRKGYSAQDCLVAMIEKWKIFIDNNGSCGALLTDLSKAFDCLPHDLLLAKLHAYGLDLKLLKPLSSYLTNRKHRVRIGNVYSTWSDILTGVPQSCIFGPLLFNIFLCDLFLFLNEIDVANYADDNTPFSCKNDPRNVILDIEHASSVLFNWCLNNGMKPNPDKYHFLHTAKDDLTIKIDQCEIKGSKKEKLLGVTIDNKLTFEPHVKNLCNKVSLKLNALARVSHYINFNQRLLIMKAFITSQFGYCPLVWMFHTRRSNNRINRLHERALRITYEDFDSTFQELLVL